MAFENIYENLTGTTRPPRSTDDGTAHTKVRPYERSDYPLLDAHKQHKRMMRTSHGIVPNYPDAIGTTKPR